MICVTPRVSGTRQRCASRYSRTAPARLIGSSGSSEGRGRGQRAVAVVGDDIVVAYRTVYVHGGEAGKRADAEVSTVDGGVLYDTDDMRYDALLGADLNGRGAEDVVARGNDAFERDDVLLSLIHISEPTRH